MRDLLSIPIQARSELARLDALATSAHALADGDVRHAAQEIRRALEHIEAMLAARGDVSASERAAIDDAQQAYLQRLMTQLQQAMWEYETLLWQRQRRRLR